VNWVAFGFFGQRLKIGFLANGGKPRFFGGQFLEALENLYLFNRKKG
jgi:hypothetical protein